MKTLWLLVALVGLAAPAAAQDTTAWNRIQGNWTGSFTTDEGTVQVYAQVLASRRQVDARFGIGDRFDWARSRKTSFDGRTLKVDFWPRLRGVELKLSADGNTLAGDFAWGTGRRSIAWSRFRMRPELLTPTATFDHRRLTHMWKHAIARGNLPRVDLRVGGDLKVREFNAWLITHVTASDPKLMVRARRKGDQLELTLWLRKGTAPGRKRLVLNGQELFVELRFTHYTPPPSPLVAVKFNAWGRDLPQREAIAQGGFFRVVAVYRQPPGDDLQRLTLERRRGGRVIRSFVVVVRRSARDPRRFESSYLHLSQAR